MEAMTQLMYVIYMHGTYTRVLLPETMLRDQYWAGKRPSLDNNNKNNNMICVHWCMAKTKTKKLFICT